MKQNKCQICGWENSRTHFHHITPLRYNGEDCNKNKIELCPNCHAEACEDELAFAKKNGLVGVKVSKDKMMALQEASKLYLDLSHSNFAQDFYNFIKLLRIQNKYCFDSIDYISYLLGLTRTSVERYKIRVKD